MAGKWEDIHTFAVLVLKAVVEEMEFQVGIFLVHCRN